MSEIAINSDRLWKSLADMARIGATKLGGSKRLALTDEDRAGRDLFVSWARAAGCGITIDEMGNIFARREGSRPEAEPVMAGSHLDTQPTGGRFDGVFGVLAGLEVIRTLADHQLTTARPFEVAVWTNEEGSRFQPAMMGSAVFAGAMPLEEALGATDEAGTTAGAELARIQYKGEAPCRPRPLHAYLEAHIEQGPVLEAEELTIGVVTGIQGIKWFKATLEGMNAHAGTTPMEVRRDPLVGAARIVEALDSKTRAFRPDAVATVGMFSVSPGSINVINQEVNFSVDLRCPEEAALLELEREFRAACDEITKGMGLRWKLEEIWYSPPSLFAPQVVDKVEAAARGLGLSARRMVSGAGHDAKHLADLCPAGMIFIPCENGISHNELENIRPEHAAAGANVLLRTILELAES